MSGPLGPFALLCFSSLLSIVNPVSAAPIYLAMTEGLTASDRRRVLRGAVVTALVVLLLFALLGSVIFRVFGITIDAFRIAGGFIFFGIGMDMLQAKRSRGKTTEEEEAEAAGRTNVGITPLGVPMIAGPGAITTVMVLMTRAGTGARVAVVLGTVVAVLVVTWIVLAGAPRLLGFFGRTGLNVMTRLMGLLVMVVGTQLVIDGLRVVVTELRG